MIKYLFSIIIILLVVFMNDVASSQKKMEIDYSKKYRNVKFLPDIVYGKGGDKDLKLDLFLPENIISQHIGIIFIHGGGWRNLSKEYLKEWGYYFADRGYTSVSIDYRLSGEAKFPAAIEDCKCAVRWMRANAGKYDINPDKVAVFGESAGGHLAALLGTSGGAKELEGKGGHRGYSSRPNLVFPVYGVFDLVWRVSNIPSRGSILYEFIGCSYDECPEKYVRAAPITYIDKSDPPFLLFHSTGDSAVSFQQSVQFEKLLKNAGVPVEFSKTFGSKHGYVLWEPHFKPTCEQMEYFMDKYFK
ncbi:alpha/beta hydrolase fold domain-containing protein [candidate division KSB1 bacterium]